MNGTGALRARSGTRTAILVLIGLAFVALIVFALLQVDLLEDVGARLAQRFEGGLPLPLTLVIVFFTGVLTSLTPCVYPVVPLAVTYLGARGATSRLRAFSLAAAYVAGMVACYTALGAAAALSGTAFGTATQRWWVYALVATVVLLFGLSMMGIFNLQLPGWLTAVAGKGKGPGYKGAVLMGATSGLVTAPCTAPVLGTLIIPMISQRSVALGSLLLAVFGLGMGMLFLLVGTYSGVLASMPRSGRWMNGVKTVLGVAILLVAGYFYWQAWKLLPGSGRSFVGISTGSVAFAGIGAPTGTAVGSSRAALSPGREDSRPPAPAFDIVDVRGQHHRLADYQGQTLHLAFLAVWCPPCLDQLRRLEIARARLHGRGYRLLAVGLQRRENDETLSAFAQEHQLEFPVAWDRDGALTRAFRVDAIPAHVILGGDGTILYQGRDLPEGFERDGAGLLGP